jgi:UDP:flavonoid glycosyltransferase YjiC (YdhE family)
VIPQAVDQHLVARQTSNLGAAVVVERDTVSAESLAAALERVESNRAAFKMAAARLQVSFADVVTITDAVDQALALMHGKQAGG